MYELPPDIPFGEWVRHVFDHPVLEPQWWFQGNESEHYESWNEQAVPDRTLEYLTHLFREPAFLMERHTRAQIDQGLNYLVSAACSNYMFLLSDRLLPWPQREACIDAMVPLYHGGMDDGIVRDFLETRTEISVELREYARWAACGRVQ